MKISTEKHENNEIEVRVECTLDQVARALEQSYRKVVRGVSVPGFRKGKVPRQILEMRYGVEVLYDDAIEILLPEAYEAALKEAAVEPIDQPDVEVVTFESDQPAVFKFLIQGPPEVKLGEYKGVEVAKVSFPVDETDVEDALRKMREEHARLVESEVDAVGDGDFVTLDYRGLLEGESFAGGEATDYTLEIGSNTFIPGFEEQLLGLPKEYQGEIGVTFPEDYRNEELAGKDVVFEIGIKDIKKRIVPSLDDDFVLEVSELETVEELRQDVKNKLQESAKLQENNVLQDRVVAAVVANADINLPGVLVEREVDHMLEELTNNFVSQGFPEQFAKEYINDKIDDIREEYQEAAVNRVKTRLVIEAVMEEEEITASDEEVAAEVQKIAEYYKQDVDTMQAQLEQQGSLEAVRDNIAREKTVQLLLDAAIQVEVPTEDENEAENSHQEETASE